MHKKIDINHSLLVRCKKGDTNAQFELYQLHSRYMYNVAYNLLQHTAEAEDAMQEAFLKAFQKIETFKGEVSFSAWLRRIVVNNCLDLLRQRKDSLSFESQENYLSLVEEDIFEDADEVLPKIQAALAQLASGYRTVLTLYLLEGYDHSEIAEFLNISKENSRSQYARGKKKLVEILKEHKTSLYEKIGING